MNKTLNALIAKAKDSHNRMPSITAIHKLLSERNIPHRFHGTVNSVQSRSGSNVYLNDRYDGKEGKSIEFTHNGEHVSMDTSDSYYSWNSGGYARKILRALNVSYND